MRTAVTWSDPTFNRHFNYYYPVVFDTPNGETIKSAEYTCVYAAGPDTVDQILRPGMEIKGLMADDMPKPKRHVASQTIMADGNGIKNGELASKFVDNITTNTPEHAYSLVVVSTKRAQGVKGKSEGIAIPPPTAFIITFTMSNDDVHVVYMTCRTFNKKVWLDHKRALWGMLNGIRKLPIDARSIGDIRRLAGVFTFEPGVARGSPKGKRKREEVEPVKRPLVSVPAENFTVDHDDNDSLDDLFDIDIDDHSDIGVFNDLDLDLDPDVEGKSDPGQFHALLEDLGR